MARSNSASTASFGRSRSSSNRLDQARARLGQVLADRWTLSKLLGVGGTASVYEAHHRNGRKAAVKVLHPEIASDPMIYRRFLREGYAANQVRHPGAVVVLDDGEDDDHVFLVMELLTGRSLAERLAHDGPLSPTEAVRVSVAVLDVLGAAHDQGIVHRDIKPSNIFELEDGNFKVLDFGVAKVRDATLGTATESGMTVGTPAFMSPEQAAGQLDQVDRLTDIWAMGATMFNLLTARHVHGGGSPNAIIVAAATTPAVPVRSLRQDVPVDLAEIVDRALAFRRADRWPNARAMRLALLRTPACGPDTYVARAPVTITEPQSLDAPSKPRPRRWALPAAIAMGAVGAAFFLGHSRSHGVPASVTAPAAPVPVSAAPTNPPPVESASERVAPVNLEDQAALVTSNAASTPEPRIPKKPIPGRKDGDIPFVRK
jgi:serine/threonine-protein kinase